MEYKVAIRVADFGSPAKSLSQLQKTRSDDDAFYGAFSPFCAFLQINLKFKLT